MSTLQAQLSQEQQAATLALQQQDLAENMTHVELVPQQAIQDALVSDVQLQTALQQPVRCFAVNNPCKQFKTLPCCSVQL